MSQNKIATLPSISTPNESQSQILDILVKQNLEIGYNIWYQQKWIRVDCNTIRLQT